MLLHHCSILELWMTYLGNEWFFHYCQASPMTLILNLCHDKELLWNKQWGKNRNNNLSYFYIYFVKGGLTCLKDLAKVWIYFWKYRIMFSARLCKQNGVSYYWVILSGRTRKDSLYLLFVCFESSKFSFPNQWKHTNVAL